LALASVIPAPFAFLAQAEKPLAFIRKRLIGFLEKDAQDPRERLAMLRAK
jgi:hypothetical protein